MKRLLTVTILLFASLLYSQSKFDINNLIDRGGLKYAPNDDEPYTGKVFDFYENGEKELDGNYRKGLMNGEWTYYHENGQIRAQGRFINGDGSYPDDYPDSLKSIYPPIPGRSGKWTEWWPNGQKRYAGTFKDGEQDGKSTYWSPDSKESSELFWKDGKEWDGKSTGWHKNGQKAIEKTYKDGEMIGLYSCDENGNVVFKW